MSHTQHIQPATQNTASPLERPVTPPSPLNTVIAGQLLTTLKSLLNSTSSTTTTSDSSSSSEISEWDYMQALGDAILAVNDANSQYNITMFSINEHQNTSATALLEKTLRVEKHQLHKMHRMKRKQKENKMWGNLAKGCAIAISVVLIGVSGGSLTAVVLCALTVLMASGIFDQCVKDLAQHVVAPLLQSMGCPSEAAAQLVAEIAITVVLICLGGLAGGEEAVEIGGEEAAEVGGEEAAEVGGAEAADAAAENAGTMMSRLRTALADIPASTWARATMIGTVISMVTPELIKDSFKAAHCKNDQLEMGLTIGLEIFEALCLAGMTYGLATAPSSAAVAADEAGEGVLAKFRTALANVLSPEVRSNLAKLTFVLTLLKTGASMESGTISLEQAKLQEGIAKADADYTFFSGISSTIRTQATSTTQDLNSTEVTFSNINSNLNGAADQFRALAELAQAF